MKNRGFTLIEILAVIVILGVIILVAVPQIINFIEKSRQRTIISSAIEYVGEIENKIFIDEEEEYYGNYNVEDFKKITKSTGNYPSSGYVNIQEGEKITIAELCINNYRVIYNDGEAKIDGTNCKMLSGGVRVVYFNPVTGKICNESESNSEYGFSNGCMKWFLYNRTSENYDLFLDHNIGSASWNGIGNTKYGIFEIKNSLKEITDKWLGVPKRTDLYSFVTEYENYSINYTDLRARLISLEEILKIGSINDFDVKKWHYGDTINIDSDISCNSEYYDLSCYENEIPISKYSYMSGCPSNNCEYGNYAQSSYWTSTAYNNNSYDRAWNMNFGTLEGKYVDQELGIRPVITVPRTLID